MKANHQFLIEQCVQLVGPAGKILDYGCGKGAVVKEGLLRGLEIYGAEAFAHGSGGCGL